MGAVRVTPTTKPSCSCMANAGDAPSPSTLNSVMATRADITPPWAEGGATGRGGRVTAAGATTPGTTGAAGAGAAGNVAPFAGTGGAGFNTGASAAGLDSASAVPPAPRA